MNTSTQPLCFSAIESNEEDLQSQTQKKVMEKMRQHNISTLKSHATKALEFIALKTL